MIHRITAANLGGHDSRKIFSGFYLDTVTTTFLGTIKRSIGALDNAVDILGQIEFGYPDRDGDPLDLLLRLRIKYTTVCNILAD